MTTRRGWIRLALAVAWIAAAALVVVPRTMAAVRYLLGPAVTFPAGRGPEGIAVSPDGRTLYAADEGYWTGSRLVNGYTVTPVSLATGQAGKPIEVGPDPASLAITPDSRTLYAVDNGKVAAFPIGA